MTPRATYRFQFHKDFTFADAEALVPYLDRLGISHVYASPITVATPGSTHGYDVTDPTRINPELGGEEAFRSLVAALRARGMGVVIDIVPNHMGVAGGANAWWNDVLARGEASEHARTFDIDFRQRIVLPVLGTPLAQAIADAALAVERHDDRWHLVAYGEHRFPIRDEDQPDAPHQPLPVLLDRQHHRLAWWRVANDELNWRRFFSINELAGVRVEDGDVFEKTHALYFRLWQEGLIDGVRIDHVDGLTDPAGYCRGLRARFDALARADGARAWIVVEKILAPGEPLPQDWGIDGTSGYDFMEEVAALLHDADGAEPLADLWHEISGRSPDLHPEELLARQQLLAWQFTGQLDACTRAFTALAHSAPEADGLTTAMLRRALERLLWVFPVYRTYGTGDAAPATDEAIRAEARARVAPHVPPGEWPTIDLILSWLAGTGPGDAALAAEAVRRFQQLSAPIAAKALEDTAFYRYGRLLARNDVGFDAARMALSPADFHARMQARAADWPRAMLTTATHDHKRGEDTRARLAVLSHMPERWRETVATWEGIADGLGADVDRGDRYMLFQALLGAWPKDRAHFSERIAAWQTKALREAKLRSSWEAPDEAYEEHANALARALIGDAGFVRSMEAFLAEIAPAAERNTLVQVALRCLAPGVPDLYQGTELADLSLVDPDNRRPVDYSAREAALDAPSPKMRLIRDLLALRRDHPALFAHGSYEPAEVTGTDHVLAFERRDGAAVLRCAVALRPTGQATIRFPSGATADHTVFNAGSVWVDIA
jgi:(1->4)-alpha-D-glucan 1-alpha-D-glucosylmutase